MGASSSQLLTFKINFFCFNVWNLLRSSGLLKLTASELTSTSESGNLLDVFSGVSSLENAIRTLHDAEGKVKVIISKRFDEAVAREDLASVERFFKIFPLINMHEEGLKKFTNYLCSKVLLRLEGHQEDHYFVPFLSLVSEFPKVIFD